MAGTGILPESTFFNRYWLRNKTIFIFIFFLFFYFWGKGERSLGYKEVTTENTAQFLKYSPGAYIFQRPFLEAFLFEGAYVRREICVSKSIGLALFLEGNLPFFFVLLPPAGRGLIFGGAIYRRVFALRLWGVYIMRGLFSEFYGTSYRVPRCLKCVWKMANSTASDNIAQWDEMNSPLFQFYVN